MKILAKLKTSAFLFAFIAACLHSTCEKEAKPEQKAEQKQTETPKVSCCSESACLQQNKGTKPACQYKTESIRNATSGVTANVSSCDSKPEYKIDADIYDDCVKNGEDNCDSHLAPYGGEKIYCFQANQCPSW